MREIVPVTDPERKLFLYFGIIFIAVGVGPFGTYEAMTFWERAMFWSLDVLGGMLIIVPILHVFYFSRAAAVLPSIPRFFLGVALGALPAAGYITILYETVAADLQISTPFPLLFVQVAVFSSILLLTEYVLWPALFGSGDKTGPARPSPPDPNDSADTGPDPVPGSALHDRLPAEFRHSQILSISMDDHYAGVTTTDGTAMILMRLADAIDLLDNQPGARIHRSHWVARDHMAGIERTGRRLDLVLKDGRRLPIGATYIAAVQHELDPEASGDEANV